MGFFHRTNFWKVLLIVLSGKPNRLLIPVLGAGFSTKIWTEHQSDHHFLIHLHAFLLIDECLETHSEHWLVRFVFVF